MNDYIWLVNAEEPLTGVKIVSETAQRIAWEQEGELRAVAAREVRCYRHGETPGELDHAMQRLEKGDFTAAERLLRPLAERDDRIGPHARYHLANVRRLRAELEGSGHEEALQMLAAWREREGDHYLAPFAAHITGEAALAAGQLQAARIAFAHLSSWGPHLALASRLGLARVKLAAGEAAGVEAALEELAALEEDALVPGDVDTIIVARIARAEALARRGEAREGLDLLLPLLDTPGMVRSPWHAAVLNTIPGLIVELAGREADGSAKPHAQIAGSYYVNRALRYGTAQPLERARTLALAVEVNTLSGRADIALMARTELGRRFASSKYFASLR